MPSISGELSGGVILSGGDGDGTLGIKAIKERGGITLAQVGDGFGPQHPDMPEAAIASGLVDFAIPADEMGAKLAEFARISAGTGEAASQPEGNAEAELIREALPEIYGILRSRVGHDFSGYKARTFTRRLQRRMHVNQLQTIQAYIERLRQDPREVGALFRDLLISVTSFFRDRDAFDALATEVIPKLFEGRGAADMVRIWVPGCATGEEVYSIAMLAREHMQRLTPVPRVQIFATDLDERALTVARAARYPAALMDSVSADRRRQFFVADGDSFVVAKDIRELCTFSPHSVIRDPPFSRIDLVSCRNLLIYLGVDVQNHLIPIFHYALRPEGYLFLGSAENLSHFNDLFATVDKHHRIFRRRSDVTPHVRLPRFIGQSKPGQETQLPSRRAPLAGAGLRHAVDQQVLERFAPTHVVVNSDGDVVYYSARTGKYLEAPAGAPTRHLLTLARKDLRLDLRTLLREAVERGKTVTRSGVAVDGEDGRVQIVDLTIEPVADRAGGEPLFLVLFSDHGPPLSREEGLERTRATQDGAAVDLERELRETRDRLQSMIEEYETALEELKSSNEELVSMNEEMQSTNEELEASKEELQSVNEELHTVNAELNGKIDALDRANSDLQNLFESTDVATVFLDRDLAIRSFTPAVAKIFSIRPTDKGRPITELSSRLDLANFAQDIHDVFRGQPAIDRQVDSDDRTAHYLVRLAPYLNGHHKIEGVVVTFVDVTTLMHAEARQRVLVAELQHRTRNLLAIVQAMAQRTLAQGPSLDSFSARLAALGRIQGLVGGATDIELAELVGLELQAIGAPESRTSVAGPKVTLGLELAQTFGLALHELATNALKHGAFKSDRGRLDVSWNIRRDGGKPPTLVLEWRESGVPEVAEPSRRGFGGELIEKALKFTLRAETDFSFRPDGVSYRIELPLPPGDAGVQQDT